MKKKYKVIALIGEAGTGKDTLLRALKARLPQLHEIVSCTTRPKRDYENNGTDYFFCTKDEFINKICNKEMLEYSIFNNWYYGTASISLKEDAINIGVFNPEGINSLKINKDIDLTVYYIKTNNKTRLLRQLNREANPNVDEIVRRYLTGQKDFCDLEFDYEIIENNGELDAAYTKLVDKVSQLIYSKN